MIMLPAKDKVLQWYEIKAKTNHIMLEEPDFQIP
jgi:hypothetical protein